MTETVKLTIDVERDGWTDGMQLSINDATGGFRLKGPKFNGSSKLVLSYAIDQRGADAIRRYLDKHFPTTGGSNA